MKKPNRTLIFTTDCLHEEEGGKCLFDCEREWMWECHEDEYADEGWQSIDDIPDQMVFDRLNFTQRDEWDTFEFEMSRFLDEGNYWLATGYCGCWDGRHAGGTYIRDFDDLRKLWDIRDALCEVYVYDEGGHLYVEVSHHDGRNCYEIVGVTKRGEEFIDSDRPTYREEHEAIMSCNFYHYLPHFARKVYGTREFTYVPDHKKTAAPLTLTADITSVGVSALKATQATARQA